MGSITAQAFGPNESADEQLADLPPLEPAGLPPGFAELVQEPRPLLVVPDSGGRLRNWTHARAQPWYGRIIVLVGERTPPEYLEHLDRRGIEHLTAGDERVDLSLALQLLRREHAVRSIRTDAGGALNGALLDRRSGGPDRGDHRAPHRSATRRPRPSSGCRSRWPTRPRCGSSSRRCWTTARSGWCTTSPRTRPCTSLPTWPLPRQRRRPGGPPSCPAPGRSGTTNVPGCAAI